MDARTRLLAMVLALSLAACAGDGRDGGTAALTPSPPAENLTSKPVFEIPDGEPPDELVTRTLVEGDGEAAEPGDTVTVHYVGKSWSTGEQFEASWDRGEPFVFQLGAGQVIPGWEQGIQGMEVGERRMIVIPPELAYGERGAGSIGPGETLVFVVDLLSVEGP